MKNFGIISTFSLAVIAGGLVGCASSTSNKDAHTSPTNVGGHGYYWKDEAPAPAPKAAPAPAPVAKAENPCKPVIGPGMMTTSQAFPTGDAATSAVSLQEVFPGQVKANANFPYKIYVSNLTSTTLNNVIVSATSLANRNIVSSTPAATSGAGGALVWNVGDIAPGKCVVIDATAKASAVGNSSTCLTVSYNNSLCSNLQVVQPALALTKAMTPAATVCDPIVATFEVKNTGSGAASNVKIKDTLPAGLTTTDGKSEIVFDAGTLASGQARQFSANLKAAKSGKYENNATASADDGLSANSNTVATTVTQPQLKLAAECPGGGPIGRSGRNFTFKFTVSNTGDAGCSTTVTAPVPAGTTFVSADNGGTAGPNGVSWNVGSLAAGASKAVSMTVKAMGAGSFSASASATCPCAGTVTANCNVATTGLPDIGTLITDDDGVVDVGNNHTFRYEVKNQGFIDLTNVKAVFTLDEGLAYVSSDATAAAAGQTITVNVGTLKVGDTRRFNIVTKGTKAGQYIIQSVTTSDQTKAVRNDEQVNYVGN
jgi:uncharacterized repeat protein (TIGR01451 family)